MKRSPIAVMVVIVFTMLLSAALLNAASVEERLDRINRLSAEERAETLEKEARNEREVVWYAAMASDRAAELIKGFESK